MKPRMDTLRTWDATETLEHLARKNVSPVEVMEAAVRRAEAARELGALVTPTFDRALADAKQPRPGPFSGVPSALKDLAKQRDVRTTFGSRGANQTPSKANEAWVSAFEGLGFVSLGKSATPELGLTATTEPLGFAPCRNPWDPTRSAGGSSGGAASLVASGVVPMAHGSDGGGSIRIPAACCGLVGLKPTRGRFDMEGSNQLPVNVAVQGVLTRSVRDTSAFWAALSQAVPRKHLPPMTSSRREPGRPLRIAFSAGTPNGGPVDARHVEAMKRVARTCESLGHRVEEHPSFIDAQFMNDFLDYWSFVAWAQRTFMGVVTQRGFDGAQVDAWTEGLCARFSSQRLKTIGAVRRLRTFHQRFLAHFERFDVLLTPTLAHPPPPLGHLSPDVDFAVQFERLIAYVPFTPAFNVSGAPAISLPLARTAGGLPIGLQFGANRGQEALLLELSAQLEAALPWPTLPT